MKIYKGRNTYIKSWCDKLEQQTLDQAMNLARLPFIYHHVALMADAHLGFGMPIGGVIAVKGAVIPNAVGVDEGCGVIAVKTSLQIKDLDIDTLKIIMDEIREVVPIGFHSHKEVQDEELMPDTAFSEVQGDFRKLPSEKLSICNAQYNSALKQLGTLGGGNHFIEIQKDKCGSIWIMIHSGSRNLGYKVANHYNKLAVELNNKWFSKVEKEWQLAFLPIDTKEARDYLHEMQYCVNFALANRKLMMNRVIGVIKEITNMKISVLEKIDVIHNYACWENHFGKNVIVHRKGATSARKGTLCIVPGSQGTASYIGIGLGNPASFNSCSHGAGRLMSRTKARETLNLNEEIKKMNDAGIIHTLESTKNLDEASSAYKDINMVMYEQRDLVTIKTKLTPLAVIKGD